MTYSANHKPKILDMVVGKMESAGHGVIKDMVGVIRLMQTIAAIFLIVVWIRTAGFHVHVTLIDLFR